jgi:hypothetical protein
MEQVKPSGAAMAAIQLCLVLLADDIDTDTESIGWLYLCRSRRIHLCLRDTHPRWSRSSLFLLFNALVACHRCAWAAAWAFRGRALSPLLSLRLFRWIVCCGALVLTLEFLSRRNTQTHTNSLSVRAAFSGYIRSISALLNWMS